ncbi:MAG: PilZ domain-containing protein [Nitrospirales bacterium]
MVSACPRALCYALRFDCLPSYNTPPCEAAMPFSIRLFRRFPVHCVVSYSAGPFTGVGTVWNLSRSGWRLSGDLPMRPGESLSLTVTLPNEQRIDVHNAVVRWSRGQEFGVETVETPKHTAARLVHYVRQLVNESS